MYALLSKIESKLGISIEHIAFEAQRNAAKATFDATFDKVPGARTALRLDRFKRLGVEYFNLVGAACSQRHSETVEYVPSKLGIARIKNPFYMPMMAAYVVGAFEAMEGVPFEVTWNENGDDAYTIMIEATSARPEFAARMELEMLQLLPGSRRFESCDDCRGPKALSHPKWDLNEGVIIDTRSGSGVLLLDGHAISAVFREMRRELGEEVDQLLIDVQREWTLEHVGLLGLAPDASPLSSQEKKATWDDYISMVALYGQGYPVSLDIDAGYIEVVVENPFNSFILAGTIQCLFEALEKTGSSITWAESKRGVAYFKVQPA